MLLLQVIELRALRDLAADMYSYNTTSIGAEEVQAKMALLRREQDVLTPSGEALHANETFADSPTAGIILTRESALLPEQSQDRSSLVPAFTGSQLFQDGSSSSTHTAQQEEDEPQEVQGSTPDRPQSSGPGMEGDAEEAESRAEDSDESDEEVAKLAEAMWEDAEDATGPDSQMGAEAPRLLSKPLVREQEAREHVSSSPARGLDGLQKLEAQPEHSVLSALVSQPAIENGVGAAQHAEHGAAGLELPLKGTEKEDMKELQEKLQIELHSGMTPPPIRQLALAWHLNRNERAGPSVARRQLAAAMCVASLSAFETATRHNDTDSVSHHYSLRQRYDAP